MQTNTCKFEPNLPMFRRFSVNWGRGMNSLEKKLEKSKPEEKTKKTKLDPDVCVWLGMWVALSLSLFLRRRHHHCRRHHC